jgi:hypothetical protein
MGVEFIDLLKYTFLNGIKRRNQNLFLTLRMFNSKKLNE